MTWQVIVVGGHTRSIGKTQLVCDLISAFPQENWIAGKITQYGHGVCAQNGDNCDCAPEEHVCAISWEKRPSDTDSGRFLAAGARRSFWLRTKQGFLAEGMPLLRKALSDLQDNDQDSIEHVILESNTLLQFIRPSLYLVVLDASKGDFKDSARLQLDRASAFVLRQPLPAANSATAWAGLPLQLVRSKPQFLQREGEALPQGLLTQVQGIIDDAGGVSL
jgi:molybdopterin-guanine dinucleotide biosynthesis protein